MLLVASPRVAPGLLSRGGWQALDAADLVLCADPADALPEAVAEAGIDVRVEESPDVASRARALVQRAATATLVWLGSPDADPGLTDALAMELSRVAATGDPPTVEILVASHDVPGSRLLDLVAVMDRLRSPGGCPWDAEQTPTSLVPYLIEEAYEAVEALESGDPAAVREELGDVLLQVVFHARMAQEGEQPFDVDDVAAGIVAKLVRRHPHVFAPDAGSGGTSASDVQQNWDRLKAAEKGRESVLDGIPAALPALARAEKVLGRIERDGGGAVPEPVGDALADALLTLVAQARVDGRDPEAVLRAAVRELEQRHRDHPDHPDREVRG
ncbi:MazG family protein [Angustibacter luteus]|uniref:MazG family protein n=1 Tax=Angustibacter luteus TaxID=658456 RepID=A0ABW1JHK6_9ACTN